MKRLIAIVVMAIAIPMIIAGTATAAVDGNTAHFTIPRMLVLTPPGTTYRWTEVKKLRDGAIARITVIEKRTRQDWQEQFEIADSCTDSGGRTSSVNVYETFGGGFLSVTAAYQPQMYPHNGLFTLSSIAQGNPYISNNQGYRDYASAIQYGLRSTWIA